MTSGLIVNYMMLIHLKFERQIAFNLCYNRQLIIVNNRVELMLNRIECLSNFEMKLQPDSQFDKKTSLVNI